MKKFHPPRLPPQLKHLRLPILTTAEKSALGILLSLLLAGGLLRAWERSGISFGPVDDWDSLRRLVIAAPKPSGDYPCAVAPDDGFLRAGWPSSGSSSGSKSSRKAGGAGGKKTGPARPLDLNTATEAQFLALPGVGPSTARAIVAYRTETGKFARPEDLLNVKGIGPKKFAALEKFVRVKGAPPDTPGVRIPP